MSVAHTVIDSPLGRLTVVAADAGLRAILWPDDDGRVPVDDLGPDDPTHPVIADAVVQLREYFAGTRTDFDLPLDLRGTEFQVQVWRSLGAIPYGDTVSYGEQAAAIGRPRAVRAVGAANGKNPVSIVLPCHRVVGADGSLTGYAGGVSTKRWLLEHEATMVGARD